ncbi:TPA: hypothetical protein DF272_01355 [Candidatus Falkowbacteria bacterium]|nr:hypothetical protein [Candidatus Falkowbacteria bacterium]
MKIYKGDRITFNHTTRMRGRIKLIVSYTNGMGPLIGADEVKMLADWLAAEIRSRGIVLDQCRHIMLHLAHTEQHPGYNSREGQPIVGCFATVQMYMGRKLVVSHATTYHGFFQAAHGMLRGTVLPYIARMASKETVAAVA